MARPVDDDVTRVVSGAGDDTSAGGGEGRSVKALPRGAQIGRYVVLGRRDGGRVRRLRSGARPKGRAEDPRPTAHSGRALVGRRPTPAARGAGDGQADAPQRGGRVRRRRLPTDAPPPERAEVQRLLAEVRWRQGDRAEARALAQVAADTYGPLGEASAADHADAQRWLQTHRLSQRDAADTRP